MKFRKRISEDQRSILRYLMANIRSSRSSRVCVTDIEFDQLQQAVGRPGARGLRYQGGEMFLAGRRVVSP